MPTQAELQALEHVITPPAVSILPNAKVSFIGRREPDGTVFMKFTAEAADGSLVSTPEFPMAAVAAYLTATFGAPAAAEFAAAAAVTFPNIRLYALTLVGAAPVVPA
ncbi:MAG: hypothetical protein EKK55_05525 [Rhodocyclaceae bacterium]|nr:MAG: hypothetical protein EKK55_05525 [Rhodocyclaceae bacterium]